MINCPVFQKSPVEFNFPHYYWHKIAVHKPKAKVSEYTLEPIIPYKANFRLLELPPLCLICFRAFTPQIMLTMCINGNKRPMKNNINEVFAKLEIGSDS